MIFGPERTLSIGSATGYSLAASGRRAWLAWCDAGVVKVATSTDHGYSYGAAVTVNSNASNYEVMLNETFVVDPVLGDLHLFWERDAYSGSVGAKLVHSHSQDNGATWSAPVVIDDGTAHTNSGLNRFYRVGAAAYNGVVGAAYATIDGSAFTTDKLWFVGSADRGATWSAPAQKFAATVALAGEPNAVIGDDGSMHVSWYDNGTNTNSGGDLYYARLTWNAAGFVWPGASTRVTTGQTCGRSRVTSSRGVVMLITNTNWGGSVADVGTVRSTDNGTTWGSVVTQATHTTDSLDHPWVTLEGDKGVMVWVDFATNPRSYGCKVTSDGGATWTTLGTAPFTPQVSSDAPRMAVTDDLFLLFGAGSSGIRYTVLPLLAPDPALTATTVLDNFNRANEDPLSDGGKWSQEITASGAAKLVTNAATRRSGSGTFDRAGSYRNDQSIVTGEVFCTLGGTLSDSEFDLILNQETSNNGYLITAQNGPAMASLARNDAASWTTLSSETGIGLVAGDKWLLRLTPTAVVALRYVASASDWQEIGRSMDTTYRTLRPGFNLVGSAAVPTVDDFGVTTLANPSNTVAPVASGTVSVSATLSVTPGTWATASGATPTRYTYQWQSSPAGAGTWSNISLAKLPFYTVSDASKDYRCVVTANNSLNTSTANSNVLSAPTGPGLIYILNPFTC